MTVRFRPHHFLCILTYVGQGYTPPFTRNYDAILIRLAAGEEVEIVEGPDDICAPLLQEKEPHCHGASVRDRDRRALRDVSAWLERPLAVGARLVLDAAVVARLRQGFADGRIRAACSDCQWTALCETVSKRRFRGTVLHASDIIADAK